jgi:hypothetical protein
LAADPDDGEDDEDVVLDEPPFDELPLEEFPEFPLDELFVSEPDEEEESELLAGSFTFSFEAPFPPERLSVL